MRQIIILTILLTTMVFGEVPIGKKFYEINTDTVRVIFPEGYEASAKRVASLVHAIKANPNRSIGFNNWKLNIVLQNQTTVSNGFVGLMPYRSNFFMTPFQNNATLGSNDWVEGLTIHEYRHALQFADCNNNFGNIIYTLFGETGLAVFSNLLIPNWYFEGDAVYTETVNSKQGRGRLPSFLSNYQEMALLNKKYNYAKTVNGSYVDIVPNHYETGFLLASYGRTKFGDMFWNDVISGTTNLQGFYKPFNNAFKNTSKQSLNAFYLQSLNYHYSKWLEFLNTIKENEVITLNNQNKEAVTFYNMPQIMDSSNTIALRSSYDKIAGFYKVSNTGKETLILRTGTMLDDYFNYNKGKIVWCEFKPSVRWSTIDYSKVLVYDIDKKKKKSIVSKSKIFSPCLNNDNSKIVAVENNDKGQCCLIIIDVNTGQIIKRLENPNNYQYSYPRWSLDNIGVIAIAKNSKGSMSILEQNVENNIVKKHLRSTHNSIYNVVPTSKGLYFSASLNGIDNIFYCKYNDTANIYSAVSRKHCLYSPAIDEKEDYIVFSENEIKGSNVNRMKIDTNSFVKLDVVEPIDVPIFKDLNTLSENEGGDIVSNYKAQDFEIGDYKRFSNSLNVHTWYLSTNGNDLNINAQSTNILNNLNILAYAGYCQNNKQYVFGATGIYTAMFPQILIGVENKYVAEHQDEDGIKFSEYQFNVKPGVAIPLQFTNGLYTTLVSLSSIYNYSKPILYYNNKIMNSAITPFQYFNNEISLLNIRKKALQNIMSQFSQELTVGYNKSVDRYNCEMYFAKLGFTLPALFNNDVFYINSEYRFEKQDKEMLFSDYFIQARGYKSFKAEEKFRASINYSFPICYPEYSLSQGYFLRMRGNLFFDFMYSPYNNESYTTRPTIDHFSSLGAELIFDTKLFNLLPLPLGIRYSYRVNNVNLFKGNDVEIFVNLLTL